MWGGEKVLKRSHEFLRERCGVAFNLLRIKIFMEYL